MENTSWSLHLYLYSGIPVLTLEGEWDEGAYRQLVETLSYLLLTAHFEVVIDLSKAYRLPLLDSEWWHAMQRLAERFSAHHGRLAFVGGPEPLRLAAALRGKTLACKGAQIHWSRTCEEALCYLQGLNRCGLGVVVRAKLALPKQNAPLQTP